MIRVSMFCLLYGDHFDLHERLVSSLLKNASDPAITINLWCNQVGDKTKALLNTTPFKIHFSDDNVPKYKVMRALFNQRIDAEWIVWMDDDSAITAADWFSHMQQYIKDHPLAAYIGKPYGINMFAGQAKFIQEAKWYRGLPFSEKDGKCAIYFAQGAYWWLRTDVMRKLDWPDPRLNHNGGDTLLGEAVRQNGYQYHKWFYGVTVNDAIRRGLSEAPAGSTRPNMRL